MGTDVLIHFMIEAIGGLGMRCALGMCKHTHHRIMVWIPFGLLTSWITVHMVG